MFDGIPVIAMEEHYWDREVFERIGGGEGTRSPDLLRRLYDLAEGCVARIGLTVWVG